jgi:hypothetical protein
MPQPSHQEGDRVAASRGRCRGRQNQPTACSAVTGSARGAVARRHRARRRACGGRMRRPPRPRTAARTSRTRHVVVAPPARSTSSGWRPRASSRQLDRRSGADRAGRGRRSGSSGRASRRRRRSRREAGPSRSTKSAQAGSGTGPSTSTSVERAEDRLRRRRSRAGLHAIAENAALRSARTAWGRRRRFERPDRRQAWTDRDRERLRWSPGRSRAAPSGDPRRRARCPTGSAPSADAISSM